MFGSTNSRKAPSAFVVCTAILLSCVAASALQDRSGPTLPKIAILPLEYADPSAAGPDLGFGLAAEVTHRLVYVPGIVVRPMDAIADLGRVPEDLERWASKMDVDHCLTGTIGVSEDRYPIEVRLQRWPGGKVVFSENISATQEELAHLPHQLAERIARALTAKDSVKESTFKGKLPSSSTYFTFLKALSSTSTTIEEKEQRLRDLEAVVQQTNYPPAAALLGRWYLDRAGEIGGRGPYYPLAEEMLKKAFELDPDFPLARELLASLFAKRGRSEQTVALMQEGLVGHPTYPGFHKTLGYVLRYGGLMDESIAAYRRAQELDGSLANLVSTTDQITKSLIYQGNYARALASHHDMLTILDRMHREPNEKQVFYEGVIHLYAGEKARAIECFQRAARLKPESVWTTFGRAYRGIAEEDRESVINIMERLERRIVVDGERHYRLVHFGAYLGWADTALEHLQKSIESGFFNAPYIRRDPITASLHDHPRFQELLQTAEARHLAFRKLLTR